MSKDHRNYIRLMGRGPWSYVFTWPGNLTVATGLALIPVVRPIVITNVAVQLATAPTGAAAIFDLVASGGTLWPTNPSNRPTVAISGTQDLTSVPDTTALSAGDWLRLDVTQIGSTVPGAQAVVVIEYI